MARRRCITHRVHVRSGKKKKNGATLGMLLIAAGVIILCLFVLPHKVLLVIAAVSLIAAGCFLA